MTEDADRQELVKGLLERIKHQNDIEEAAILDREHFTEKIEKDLMYLNRERMWTDGKKLALKFGGENFSPTNSLNKNYEFLDAKNELKVVYEVEALNDIKHTELPSLSIEHKGKTIYDTNLLYG